RRSRPAAGEGMTLVEHLAELRSRLIKALVGVAIGALLGFLLYSRVLGWMVEPYCRVKAQYSPGSTCRLVVTDPLESFSIRLKLSTYLGFLFACPIVMW